MSRGRHRRGPSPIEHGLRAAACAGVVALAVSVAVPEFVPGSVAAVEPAAVEPADATGYVTASALPTTTRATPTPAPSAAEKDRAAVEVPSAPPVSTESHADSPAPPTATPTTPRVSTTTTAPPTTTPEPEPTTTTRRPPPSTTTTTTRPPAPAQEPPPPPPAPPAPARGSCSTTLDGTVAHVAQAGNHIRQALGFEGRIIGRASRSRTSDHPSGHALDFMTSDRAVGDALADYALRNREQLGVTYVIWRQRYNPGSGWEQMQDRGGVTANHFDHVHVSFARTPPKEAPAC